MASERTEPRAQDAKEEPKPKQPETLSALADIDEPFVDGFTWNTIAAMLFIGVVMGFPNGLAGLYESHIKPRLMRRKPDAPEAAPAASTELHSSVATSPTAPADIGLSGKVSSQSA